MAQTSAFWGADLIAIDGFDCGFSGWGREDSDLFVRLMRAGVRRKDGHWATGALHLWHSEADRSRLPENDRQLDEVLASDRIRAARGCAKIGKQSRQRQIDGSATDRQTETRCRGS